MAEKKPLLKATAMPVGHAAKAKEWAEQDARAKAYRHAVHTVQLTVLTEPKPAPPPPPPRMPRPKKPKKIWDNCEDIGLALKSKELGIRVSAVTRDGSRCVIMREMYYNNKRQVWLPSRNGITIPLKNPLIRTRVPDPDNPPTMVYPMHDVIELIQKAIVVAETMELSDPSKAVYAKPKKEKPVVRPAPEPEPIEVIKLQPKIKPEDK